jgi:hypothetical protein
MTATFSLSKATVMVHGQTVPLSVVLKSDGTAAEGPMYSFHPLSFHVFVAKKIASYKS